MTRPRFFAFHQKGAAREKRQSKNSATVGLVPDLLKKNQQKTARENIMPGSG